MKKNNVRKKLLTRKKHKKRKRLLNLFFIFLVIFGLAYAGYTQLYPKYLAFQDKQKLLRARPSVRYAKDGTSISAAWHKTDMYHDGIKKYSFAYKAAYNTPAATWDGFDFVIPGLISTRSYDYPRQRITKATKMTPQGIAVVYKYILITAYDGAHEHSSAIWVLDKKTGKYLKTIHISGKPHLGGIAYDPKGMEIWITGSKNGKSALMSFSLAKLIEYINTDKSPSEYMEYDTDIPIDSIVKASTLAYYDDQLFVGYFNQYKRGKVATYKISRSGKYKNTITTNEITSVTDSVAWSSPDGSTTMNKQIQGIAIYHDKIFLSQSYGKNNSRLYIFPITAINNLDEKNAEKVIEMPPYLEQITAYKGQLLCLFESGSSKYASSKITVMDRVLSMNINALLGN